MTEGILYTTQLQAGLGLVDETKELLDLWVAGMTASQLHQLALTSGLSVVKTFGADRGVN